MPKDHTRKRRVAIKNRKQRFTPGQPGTKFQKPRRDWEANGVAVSDHAVVRYLEIVAGMDIAKVRQVMTNGRAALIRSMSTGRVPLDGGAKMIVRSGIVVTVVKPRNEYERNEQG